MTHADNRPDPVRPDPLRPMYVRYASGPLVVLGLWLALSPFLLDYPTELAIWVDVAGGLLIALIALVRLARPMSGAALSWISFALGLFMVAMPIFFQFVGTTPEFWVNLFTGLMVVILSGMSASESLGIEA